MFSTIGYFRSGWMYVWMMLWALSASIVTVHHHHPDVHEYSSGLQRQQHNCRHDSHPQDEDKDCGICYLINQAAHVTYTPFVMDFVAPARCFPRHGYGDIPLGHGLSTSLGQCLRGPPSVC